MCFVIDLVAESLVFHICYVKFSSTCNRSSERETFKYYVLGVVNICHAFECTYTRSSKYLTFTVASISRLYTTPPDYCIWNAEFRNGKKDVVQCGIADRTCTDLGFASSKSE